MTKTGPMQGVEGSGECPSRCLAAAFSEMFARRSSYWASRWFCPSFPVAVEQHLEPCFDSAQADLGHVFVLKLGSIGSASPLQGFAS